MAITIYDILKPYKVVSEMRPKWRDPKEDYDRFSEEERKRYNINKPRTSELGGKSYTVTHRFGAFSFGRVYCVYNSVVDPCPNCCWHVATVTYYHIGDADIVEGVAGLLCIYCDNCDDTYRPVYIKKGSSISKEDVKRVENNWNKRIRCSVHDMKFIEETKTLYRILPT
ncbi:MAG: hypothetical protein GY861_22150 [bacterium]|nr:hypothetical protein [bacterium]